ncbi:hypothetical protein [Spirosoma linguale]
MLEQLYKSLKEHLLAINGMTAHPYQTKTGKGPEGGIEQFDLEGKNFASMRLTDKYVMIYLGPALGQADPTAWYSQQLSGMLKGKGCLKVVNPAKTDISPVLTLWNEGAAKWKRD